MVEIKGKLFVIFFIFGALILSACSREDSSPEGQIRQYIKTAEKAAEERDTGSIKKLISEKYTDERKRTKDDLVRVTAGYFLRHKTVHLFTHIGSLVFSGEEVAELQLFVAMAGSPITGAEMLFDIRADFYRFDMMLIKEGKDWRLLSAQWRQATKEDFFPENPE